MAQRMHGRQQMMWQFDDLQRLEDEGKAKLLSDHGIWIVKRDEGGQVAVRPEQILVSSVEEYEPEPDYAAEIEAENAWLRAAEDGGDEYHAFEQWERSQGKIDQSEAAAIAEAQALAQASAADANLLAKFGVKR